MFPLTFKMFLPFLLISESNCFYLPSPPEGDILPPFRPRRDGSLGGNAPGARPPFPRRHPGISTSGVPPNQVQALCPPSAPCSPRLLQASSIQFLLDRYMYAAFLPFCPFFTLVACLKKTPQGRNVAIGNPSCSTFSFGNFCLPVKTDWIIKILFIFTKTWTLPFILLS